MLTINKLIFVNSAGGLMESIYDRLEKATANRGMTLSGLAEKIGLARSAATRWRNGGGISPGNLNKAAEILHVTKEWLKDGDKFNAVVEQDQPEYDGPYKNIIKKAINLELDHADKSILDVLEKKYSKQ